MAPVDTDVKLRRMYLNKRYKSSFTGAKSFHESLPPSLSNVKYPQVLKALQHIRAYTQHRPAPSRIKRRKVLVHGIDQQWQIDLISLPRLAAYNNQYRHIFMCIDVFSKYLWAVPMKRKTAVESLKVFKNILRTSGRKPQKIQVDKGNEFKGSFKTYCTSIGIPIFHVESELKACIVERVNRTILERVWRYMQHKNTYTWYKVLPDMIRNYNATKHHSTKFAPNQVNELNSMDVWMNLYGKYEPKAVNKPKFKIGDKVHISVYKNKFVEKGYDVTFHPEVFTIVRISDSNPRMYYIRDDKGETLQGGFYREELSKIYI